MQDESTPPNSPKQSVAKKSPTRSSRGRKKVIIITIVLLVLVAAGVGVWYWWQSRDVVGDGETDGGILIETPDNLKSQIDAAGNNKDKAKLYSQLYTTELLDNDQAGALDAAKAAVAADSTVAEYHMQLGSLLEQQGDIAGAIDSYKAALALTPQTGGPTDNTPYNNILGKIQRLGGDV